MPRPTKKPSPLVAELAKKAQELAASRSRAKVRGPAMDFVTEVLAHNDGGGATITIDMVRRTLAEKYGIEVTNGAILRTVQNKLGRTSWATP